MTPPAEGDPARREAVGRVELEESHRRLEAILAATMDAVITIDERMQVVLFNESAERIFGCPAKEAVGTPVERFLPERFRPGHDRLVREFGAGEVAARRMQPARGIFALRADGSEFPAEGSISHASVGGRQIYTVVLRDVSERVAAESQIRQLNEELERRVRERTSALTATLKELEEFSYTVSHDLRAPLRAIDGYANIVFEDEADNISVESRRQLGEVSNNARRMGRLIDGLLAFTRLSRLELADAPVDMGKVVQEVVADLQESGAAARTRFDIGPLATVRGDREMLRTASAHLIDNAVKFSREAARPVVQVRMEHDGAGPVFAFEDNGAGFDMRYAGKLFGIFQRLHHESEFEGTGVGLAITRRIIERHGGRIWGEAVLHEKAIFRFALPTEVHGKPEIEGP